MSLFRYVEINCLHHAFLQLGNFSPVDSLTKDAVPKSKLSVICLNISSLLDRRFNEKLLLEHVPESESLTFAQFLDFLQSKFLSEDSLFDVEQLRRLCWHITSRGFVRSILSNDEAYKVWMIFSKLNNDQTLKLDGDETSRIIGQFARAVAKTFDRKKLDEYDHDRPTITFWTFLRFFEECLTDVEPNVYREVLIDVYDEVVRDVVKKGYLKKKGHKRHTWKERWFVLEPHFLIYYKSRDNMEEKGAVHITSRSQVEAIAEKTNYKFRILVTDGANGTKYELCASDQRSKMEWIGAIKHVIERDPEDVAPFHHERLERLHEKDMRRRTLEQQRQENEEQKKQLEELRLAREEAEQQKLFEQQWLQEEMQRRREAEDKQRRYLEELDKERLQKLQEENEKLSKEEQLEEEVRRRHEIQTLHEEQQRQMEFEQQRLLEMQKQNEEFMQLLQLEREKYEKAEEERQKMEELYKQALARGERPERPKFEVKMSPGLAKLIGPKDFPLVSHRGPGAFPKVFSPDSKWLEKRKSRSKSPDTQDEKKDFANKPGTSIVRVLSSAQNGNSDDGNVAVCNDTDHADVITVAGTADEVGVTVDTKSDDANEVDVARKGDADDVGPTEPDNAAPEENEMLNNITNRLGVAVDKATAGAYTIVETKKDVADGEDAKIKDNAEEVDVREE